MLSVDMLTEAVAITLRFDVSQIRAFHNILHVYLRIAEKYTRDMLLKHFAVSKLK